MRRRREETQQRRWIRALLMIFAVAFSMYDLDGNGKISRDEMIRIMESFYKLVGPLVTYPN